ncbi:hypothetical protein SAICODRAFT_68062 [Saitoella complicata NRRL Y-17804]|uniref:Uncharacterized protein n=1 Tax=Saitoella complicata (strain BCRC 22490 / CBS 7301 / JCM 7358 / NBRC 10748 / NRRL Y-17804) TaxID=698492 RepID=A0A0E9NJZ4_SAICN|nr:uncharacterized protein SAICODRAFT_68062 [Saitoella complicata NRRL Y-17804]ODQ50035.1 hypothetical protein SAICODRAFT_68062 [Saitoella complicata NRRL Y-17804]GAO49725.1 hypothetical protein G7K_3868-t1 [Saitoella complicata NRRL Y-17804]
MTQSKTRARLGAHLRNLAIIAHRAEAGVEPVRAPVDRAYEAKLDRLISDLQGRVKARGELIAQMRAGTRRKSLSEFLDLDPTPASSPLPSILARRETEKTTIAARQEFITSYQSLQQTRQEVQFAEENLRVLEDVGHELRTRLEKLEAASPANTRSTDTEQKIVATEQTFLHLLRQLTGFIDTHLAPRLYAETRGAPLGTLDVPGKDREPRRETGQSTLDAHIAADKGTEQKVKRLASEMKELLEELMNQAVDTTQDGYITVDAESVCVQMLTRSGIAVDDPRDSRRIKLCEWGSIGG